MWIHNSNKRSLNKINLGIIGAGKIVKSAHFPAYLKNANVDIKYICDSNASVEEELRLKELEIPFSTRSDEVINSKLIDVIIICTPPKSHYELCKQSLMAGKHVLCQKPFCGDLEAANKLITLAEKRRLSLFVNETFRWYPVYKKVKELIENDEIGYPILTVFEDFGWSDYHPYEQSEKKFLLLRNSSHKLDLFRFWFGDNIQCIDAKLKAVKEHPVNGELIVLLNLQYSDNHMVHLIDNGASSIPGYRKIVIHGSKGGLRIDDNNLELFKKKKNKRSMWEKLEVKGSIIPDAFNDIIDLIANSIISGEKSKYNAKDYIKTLELVEGAYLSSELGKPIQIRKKSFG